MSETVQRDPMMKWLAVGIFGVLFMMVVMAIGGGVGMYYAFNRPAQPAPGPMPSPNSIAVVIVGEHAKADSAVYESYFNSLAQLIETDTTGLKQREQAAKLIQMTGTVGRRFVKGNYQPTLTQFIAQQFAAWNSAGELTPADRQAIAARLRQLATDLHAIHE